jgi:FlaG/FlaF family flagellin (archaellin)
LSLFAENTDATSPVIGGILTIAITISLAALVILLFHIPDFTLQDSPVPAIFKITGVTHGTNFESTMIVKNTDAMGYKNKNLYAKTYKNGIPLGSVISTMNGHDFISSHHIGVQYIKGMTGQTWNAGQAISINYKDKTFHPDEEITFEVYDNSTDQIISRHKYTA